ncbi:hypothetical protein BVZ64_00643 [Haemophilus influenzae]|uniref:Uncharacterized protein n=1 Tax=Haemophilus influenzae TaxID=727 RepID=A0A2S9RN53_HAEIF|nr:hypothetical protein BV102_00025 [Haemophilus influenzae]PRJ90594.1 hypothetical protein BV166_00969 [Haemophilus influenzae]PRK61326.1 hypothetical protein BV167_01244 [Haemophilus influenzae]PRM17296.1 hypothetical protein BV011_00539 [Haemophilus influenzae]PRM49143.1 hypothetical protein BVZ64_00643 [Haemophilus influenzae]
MFRKSVKLLNAILNYAIYSLFIIPYNPCEKIITVYDPKYAEKIQVLRNGAIMSSNIKTKAQKLLLNPLAIADNFFCYRCFFVYFLYTPCVFYKLQSLIHFYFLTKKRSKGKTNKNYLISCFIR